LFLMSELILSQKIWLQIGISYGGGVENNGFWNLKFFSVWSKQEF
jgi:hypothetical protein